MLKFIRNAVHTIMGHPPRDEDTFELLLMIFREVRDINWQLGKMFEYLVHKEIHYFHIVQLGDSMAISGVQPGLTGTFAATPQPVGAVLPSGVVPVWTVDNPLVTLTPAADGLTVIAALDASITGDTFNLTVTATLADGSTPSGTVAVPILPTPPPPPQEVTGFTIDQTA